MRRLLRLPYRLVRFVAMWWLTISCLIAVYRLTRHRPPPEVSAEEVERWFNPPSRIPKLEPTFVCKPYVAPTCADLDYIIKGGGGNTIDHSVCGDECPTKRRDVALDELEPMPLARHR